MAARNTLRDRRAKAMQMAAGSSENVARSAISLAESYDRCAVTRRTGCRHCRPWSGYRTRGSRSAEKCDNPITLQLRVALGRNVSHAGLIIRRALVGADLQN